MVEQKTKVEREVVDSITIHQPTEEDNAKYREYEQYCYDSEDSFSKDWQDFKFDTHTEKDCKTDDYDILHIRSEDDPNLEISIHVVNGKLSIFSRNCDLVKAGLPHIFELKKRKRNN